MKKKAISLRVDPEVLDWFRSQRPRGYQSFMHAVLSEYMENEKLQAERLAGRAQELFRQFYAQCFWHYQRDLEITTKNIGLVIEGLRKYGGRAGYILADELCQ